MYDAIDELITEQVLTQSFEAQATVKESQPFFYPLDKLLSIGKMIEKRLPSWNYFYEFRSAAFYKI